MSTSRSFFEYVSEQWASITDVRYRAMMGEYIIYYRGKVVGGIYDDRVLVKITPSAKKILKDAPEEVPYEGAKPMLLVSEIEETDYIEKLFDAVFGELKK